MLVDFFFKQKTAYEMRISDWSSDVCSSDLTQIMTNTKFTPGRIASFVCPAGKQQAFLRDAEQPGLGLRVTTAGAKSYIFQGKPAGQVIRMTLGRSEEGRVGQECVIRFSSGWAI